MDTLSVARSLHKRMRKKSLFFSLLAGKSIVGDIGQF